MGAKKYKSNKEIIGGYSRNFIIPAGKVFEKIEGAEMYRNHEYEWSMEGAFVETNHSWFSPFIEERIEVKLAEIITEGVDDAETCLYITRPIPKDKIQEVKKAVERVINGEEEKVDAKVPETKTMSREETVEWFIKNQLNDLKRYGGKPLPTTPTISEKELLDAEERAFNAGREKKDFWGSGLMQYPSFSDYKNKKQ